MWRIYLTSSLKNITNFKHTLTPHLCPPLESTQHIAWDESSELPTTIHNLLKSMVSLK